MSDAAAALWKGLAGRYALERALGAGGMATVYLARDLKHERLVAIKVLRPELGASLGAERFLREIRIAAQLHHPHILGLLDSGEMEGQLYYVMPYVEGESLRDRIVREGALPVADALRILNEIADALAAAHARGVVHRDVKPENILLEGRHALVMDFGVAKAVSDATGPVNMTGTGVSIGTPAYMAPEQIAGESGVDHRADIYALGLVAYEMLVGRTPFSGASAQQMLAAHMTQQPASLTQLRATIPPALNALVLKCLEKQPADRWQSAEQLLPELAALATTSGSAPLASPPAPAVPRNWRYAVAGIAATMLVVAGGWWLSQRRIAPTASSPDIRSIAVLPFTERNTEGGEFLGDGMAETLIYALGKVPGFKVAAQTSSFSFRGKEADLATIGQKLGVATVLTGSLQRAGKTLRVTVRLESVADHKELWTERYDRERTDVFALQDDIARAVVSRLQSSASQPAPGLIVNAGTKNVEAYQAYLQGRFFWGQRGAGIAKGLVFFERAVALDSNYALAWSGIADSYSLLNTYGNLPTREAMPKARHAADHALQLDSTLAQAHAALAYILHTYEYDWAGANREFRRAIELDPSYVVARYWYGLFLISVYGRDAEGLEHNRKAVSLDPLSPHAANQLSQALASLGATDEAIAEARRAISLSPTWTNYRILGIALSAAGRHREAITAFDSANTLSAKNGWAEGPLVEALVKAGDTVRARTLYDELATQARSVGAFAPFAAVAASWLGDTDAAIRWLERARAEHSPALAWPRLLWHAPVTAREARIAAFWASLGITPAPGTEGRRTR